jgi:HEAT repeat protein
MTESAAKAPDGSQHDYDRWQETLELARRKDPSTKPILTQRLKDDYQLVRGAAAWGLSQIGGTDAQDALLDYLNASVTSKNGPDLLRATEAEKELPDKRAVNLLAKCLQIETDGGYIIKSYAAEALGKIGDSKSSIYLARQLNIDLDYVESRDYWYLKAIGQTKGAGALPLLVQYLDRFVQKMTGQDLSQYQTKEGHEYRQVEHNFRVYKLTVSALESITGRKSTAGSREEVGKDWKDWWQKQSVK